MASQTKKPLVFCFGRDQQLLETRCLVLATKYNVRGVSTFEEFETLSSEEGVRLILLCHTLSRTERDRVKRIARSRWPGVKLLQLRLPREEDDKMAEVPMFLAMQGPAALLRQIDHELSASPVGLEGQQ